MARNWRLTLPHHAKLCNTNPTQPRRKSPYHTYIQDDRAPPRPDQRDASVRRHPILFPSTSFTASPYLEILLILSIIRSPVDPTAHEPSFSTPLSVMSDPEQPSHGVEAVDPSTTPSGDATSNNYAFLVHSQKTLTQNLPPKVDNKALARQKRRRTSPDDQKVLEAEYQRNPKPDRATRADIVTRVTLGEKEVQIWFQNRRQNDRRRSKPLDPAEFKSSKSSASDHNASSEDNTAQPYSQSTQLSNDRGNGSQTATDASFESISPQTSFDGTEAGNGGEAVSSQPEGSQSTVVSQPGELRAETINLENPPNMERGTRRISAPVAAGFQAINRKRARSEPEAQNMNNAAGLPRVPTSSTFVPPALRISLSFDGEAVVRKEGEKTPSPPKPRDSIRISMSADGEALIRAGNEESPTKDRTSILHNRRPLGGLRRSISAIPLTGLRTPDQRDSKAFGRSRDSRNWELYCDTDARTALSGSKNSPLSSFSSRSTKISRRKSEVGHRKALMPRTNMPNTQPVSEEPVGKRKKLSRAVSSLARLESGQKYKAKDGIEFYSGDSDKENWVPGTQMSNQSRRVPNKQKGRRGILQKADRISNENRPAKTTSKMHRGYRGRHPKGTEDPADIRLAQGQPRADELTRFMSATNGPSQDEDLDCIQGLLSLSQGAWK
ncbi:hypothetical protein FQN51_009545 [Onygenales sp. PD_10]|nr:hypothetical protein FQN51_009545 [Onygenales sp. PD_10]